MTDKLPLLTLLPVTLILGYLEQWDAVLLILAAFAFFVWSDFNDDHIA